MGYIRFKLYSFFLFFIFIFSCTTYKNPISGKNEPDYILKSRIKEYEYVQNQFFLVDFYYQSVFESSFDPSSMRWLVQDPGRRIQQLEVWITTHPTEFDACQGWAVLGPITITPEMLDSLVLQNASWHDRVIPFLFFLLVLQGLSA